MKVLALCLPEEKQTDKGIVKEFSRDDLTIVEAAKQAGHDVTLKAYSPAAVKSAKKYDAVLNLCDGFEEDAAFVEIKVAKNLEKHKLKFTGNKSETFRVCNNKAKIKEILDEKGIPTAPFAVYKKVPKELDANLSFPVMVKPIETDAAVGIHPDSVANNLLELKKNVKRVLKEHNQPALVEKYLEGQEYCVPVLGNKNPKALRPVKVTFKQKYYGGKQGILSYEAKWGKGDEFWGIRTRPSKKPNPKIQKLAENAYKALNLRGYGTVDIRANAQGELFVLEVNPNCWIGARSDASKSAKASGISHAMLIDKIIKLAKSS